MRNLHHQHIPSKRDLTGKQFGKLVVLSFAVTLKGGPRMWNCLCDCGKSKVVSTGDLNNKRVKSCGCLQTKHGQRHTPTYEIWKSMRNRCANPNHKRFHRYGGRGIAVCSEWDDFKTFMADMGRRPAGMSLERDDNDGPYCKANCRWATPTEQNNNRITNRRLTHNGKTQTIAQWSREQGLSFGVLSLRLDRGWSVARTLDEPLHERTQTRKEG